MAVIAGTAADPGHGKALWLTLATLAVFWLAHVYAQTLSHHLKGAKRLEWPAVKAAMVEEQPLLEGPVPMLVVLALGTGGLIDQDLAWRLFTRSVTPEQASPRATFAGDQQLAERVLQMVSIIA